jgi:hypothetical protein
MTNITILSCVGGVRDYRQVLDWMIGFTDTLCTPNNMVLLLIYTLYKSLGHTKTSRSSLVVSWQWIYNSLTVTANHT